LRTTGSPMSTGEPPKQSKLNRWRAADASRRRSPARARRRRRRIRSGDADRTAKNWPFHCAGRPNLLCEAGAGWRMAAAQPLTAGRCDWQGSVVCVVAHGDGSTHRLGRGVRTCGFVAGQCRSDLLPRWPRVVCPVV
jgi:hypothetical protein